jgi:hypothetical protein
VAGTCDESARTAFESALRLHLCHRFDPEGLNPAERATLRSAALAVASALNGTIELARH